MFWLITGVKLDIVVGHSGLVCSARSSESFGRDGLHSRVEVGGGGDEASDLEGSLEVSTDGRAALRAAMALNIRCKLDEWQLVKKVSEKLDTQLSTNQQACE